MTTMINPSTASAAELEAWLAGDEDCGTCGGVGGWGPSDYPVNLMGIEPDYGEMCSKCTGTGKQPRFKSLRRKMYDEAGNVHWVYNGTLEKLIAILHERYHGVIIVKTEGLAAFEQYGAKAFAINLDEEGTMAEGDTIEEALQRAVVAAKIEQTGG